MGFADCRSTSQFDATVGGVSVSLCRACAALPDVAAALDKPRATRWSPLDLTRSSLHLRELARGLAPVTDPRRAAALGVPVGALAPVLTLEEAAQLLGLAGPQSVQTAERREAGKGLAAHAPGTCTLSSLQTRATAYGLSLEVRVRVQR